MRTKVTDKQARAAVHIAATVMRAAGLCKMAEPFACRRAEGGADAKFSTCVDCIERWLYRKARDRVRDDTPKASPWIAVMDALPPNDDDVLAVVSGNCGNVLFKESVEIASYDDFDRAWTLEAFPTVNGITVTHWMPLPAAPGGAGK